RKDQDTFPVPIHAHRGGDLLVQRVGLTDGAGLMAEGHAAVEVVQTDAGEDPPIIQVDGRGTTRLSCGPPTFRLCDGRVDKNLIKLHGASVTHPASSPDR